jgi:hypothetical protein
LFDLLKDDIGRFKIKPRLHAVDLRPLIHKKMKNKEMSQAAEISLSGLI